MMNADKIDIKAEKYFSQWRTWLRNYLINHGDDITNYDNELLRELFANGLTVAQAYKQLQSELKVEKDDDDDT